MPLTKLLKKPAKDYSKLERSQLLDDHRIRHAWYSSTKQGKQIHDKETGKLLTLKDISEQHTKIVRKMFSLKMNHNYIPNSVDQTLPQDLKKKSKKESKSMLNKIIESAILRKIKNAVPKHKNIPLSPSQVKFWKAAFQKALKKYKNSETAGKVAWSIFDKTFKIKDKKWIRKNAEKKYTHKDCKNFKNGRCTLRNINVDPDGPVCPSFEPKDE